MILEPVDPVEPGDFVLGGAGGSRVPHFFPLTFHYSHFSLHPLIWSGRGVIVWWGESILKKMYNIANPDTGSVPYYTHLSPG